MVTVGCEPLQNTATVSVVEGWSVRLDLVCTKTSICRSDVVDDDIEQCVWQRGPCSMVGPDLPLGATDAGALCTVPADQPSARVS